MPCWISDEFATGDLVALAGQYGCLGRQVSGELRLCLFTGDSGRAFLPGESAV